MQSRLSAVLCFSRCYATRYPRPKPGTAERPPYHTPDPLSNNPNATVKTLPDEDLTFIHRPPPTMPSPFSMTTSPSSPLLRLPTQAPEGTPLPPPLRQDKPGPERASDELIARIRQLRFANPAKYTRTVLAKMFGCTPHFVQHVAALPMSVRRGALKKREREHAAAREKWSERHSLVKAVRAKRREFW